LGEVAPRNLEEVLNTFANYGEASGSLAE
jgi:hypothetical protein